MFRGYGESYDFSIPKYITAPYIQLSKAIFMGEFRFDIENIGFNEQTRNEFLETKRSVFENGPSNQAFIYMHSNLPGHSQNSGACLPDEVDQYEGRLVRANFEMQQDVDLIVGNDPGAIVIVAGDHGPYLTKNCTTTSSVYDVSEISRLDIQDRYATFLAIRWPTEGFMRYDGITVLQDLFPVVVAYIYYDVKVL